MELRVGMVSAGRVSERKENMQLRVMRMIGSAYAAIAPGLAAVAVAGVLVAIALRSVISIPRGIIGFALACFAAVFTRLVLLAYIHVTSFPTINSLYLSPATPFLIVFIVLGLYLAWLAAIYVGSALCVRGRC